MFAAGAREVLPGVHGLPDRIHSVDEIAALADVPEDPRFFHCIAAHLFGTAKMGLGQSSSVVGPELEAHELRGLYVFDSSVFPTNMGVNPQHTISAVSWLASERLAERVARRKRAGLVA
jgi:choline dehydrogenase-like flavoprotein